MDRANWWEKRWFLALLVFLSATPLLWPETPPLVDVPGHMARYRVQLDLTRSADLQRYFEFHWALIGNLGVDLLVMPLAAVFGLEAAVKIIAISIPPLTVVGLLWVAKEVHSRIPPATIFAIPFVYGYSFNFGFLNFSLSLALSLNAFALWLHLTNASRFRLRNLLFIPVSCILWVTHAFGWGVLGLLAFSAEVIRLRDAEHKWPSSISHAAIAMTPLALPLLLMVIWRSGNVSGATDRFFSFTLKAFALVATLRDRWLVWDCFGVGAALLLIGAAIFDRRLELSRKLALPAVVLAVAFVLMPGLVFGSAYADMRLAPLMFMVAIVAIRSRFECAKVDGTLAWLGLGYVLLRLAGNMMSFGIADRETRTLMHALDHIPSGAPVLALSGDYYGERWAMPRHTHLASFVTIRNYGFSNDQWQAAGAQLLRIKYSEAGRFTGDPSSFVYSAERVRKLQEAAGEDLVYDRRPETALQIFPRDAFDYVWMIDPPDFDMKARPGLTPIWRADRSVLYRVDHNYRRAGDGSALPATTGSRCVEYAAKEGDGKCWRNPK